MAPEAFSSLSLTLQCSEFAVISGVVVEVKVSDNSATVLALLYQMMDALALEPWAYRESRKERKSFSLLHHQLDASFSLIPNVYD